MKNKVEKFIQFIKESNNIVFFGGAGVSTESGIPDFRSTDGLYNQHDVQFENFEPEYLLSNTCLYDNPKVFYEFYRQKLDTRNIEPNVTHSVLAKLEAMGKLKAVITQNIDGLHQKAGSKNVIEIHGTTQRNYCSICLKEYDPDFLFTSTEAIPKCECGGLIRPGITLYEEMLPMGAWNASRRYIEKADMLIVAGTSLTVYPAAGLCDEYFSGERTVMINKTPTFRKFGFGKEKDLFIQDSLGNVFTEIEKWLEEYKWAE